MRVVATKSSSQEAQIAKSFGSKNSVHSNSRGASIFQSYQPIIQRKPGCPCGGGCPGCNEEESLQAKLKISSPGDKYEQEADRVAEQVMRMPEPGLQRQVEEEEQEEVLQAKPLAGQITPVIQRQVEEEELLQAKSATGQTPEVTPALANRVNALRGGGQQIDPATLAFMEPRFGHGFSQVRVHTDAQAAETALSVNARAFTVGRDVVFGAGQYAPGTSAGQRFLAHELTHVVQQTSAGPGKRPGLSLQRQEDANDRAKKVVIANPRIDVRAQFALLRLLRGSAEDAATARAMIDEIEKNSLKGIFGDDLGKAVEIASIRGMKRWELVPKGQDAVWIHDAILDSPVIVFKEAAGKKPRLDRALIAVYRADFVPIDPFCLHTTHLAPTCLFTEAHKAILNTSLARARARTGNVSQLLKTPDGRDLAKNVAEQLFSDPVPSLDEDEIDKAVNGTLGILNSSTIKFACRTCGDLNCQGSGVVAYVHNPGQMPIFICASRLLSTIFIKETRRTIIHEAVHLSGIDTDKSKDEAYCENVPACGLPCHGKENAESWARYIDCLGDPGFQTPPLKLPPLVIPTKPILLSGAEPER